ncbi:MAG: SpoIID/LytB domain-containing protein [Oscillospiraceae bacterium]|nr:SpoIID/LytB domain-containing protein [Oscillospiraceae bacterium]
MILKGTAKNAAVYVIMLAGIPALSLLNPERYAAEPSPQVEICRSDREFYTVYLTNEGKTVPISALDYSIGSVLAQMPADYSEEALKAQAVAANTYALRLCELSSLDGADFSDDRTLYQEFFTEDEAKAFFGNGYEEAYEKAYAACSAVSGEYLAYEGIPIAAVFHPSSWEYTESAETAFGEAVPYLASVPSMTEKSQISEEITLTLAEISARFEANFNEKAEGVPLTVTEKSPAGTVLSAELYGKPISGNELSELLNLPSARFEFSINQDDITFTLLGSGHLCGMCQQGAQNMALDGWDYREILLHFYSVPS